MEATQMSIRGWMDTENVICTYNGILHILQEEGNPVTWYNMDEPWEHNATWNKPVTQGQIVYDCTHMKYLK